MKINELTKYDLVVIDFMSGDDQVTGLDLATKDSIEVLQTGTGSKPTIFNIERDSLQGAIFVSHLRHSGVNFEDVSGEGHVAPGMQGKSAMMRDAAEEQGFDVTELPMTTDLDEEGDYLSDTIAVGNTVMIMKFDAMSNRRTPTEVTIVDYVKQPGARPAVRYKGKDGKEKSMAANLFKARMRQTQGI